MTKRISKSTVLEVLSVLCVILNSGGNPKVRSIAILGVSALALLIKKRKWTKLSTIVSLLLISYFTLNVCIVNGSRIDIKEFVVLLIRVVCCMIIASNISFDRFFYLYIKIIVCLCCMSLFWLSLLLIGIYPPFVSYDSGIYASVFQTIGFKLSERRNSGVFSEPGLFQIHINLAFISLNYSKQYIFKKKNLVIALFVFTILTTKSAMGYGCLLISLVTYFINNREIGHVFGNKKNRNELVLFAGGLVLLFELQFHVVTSFITSWSSYTSRHDDTILGLLIARDHPIFGIGLANNNRIIWESYFDKLGTLSLYDPYNVGNLKDLVSSNGLINCLYQGGIPFTILYSYFIIKTYFQRLCVQGWVERTAIVLFFFMAFMGEPYMLTPIFLIFIYYNKNKTMLHRVSCAS